MTVQTPGVSVVIVSWNVAALLRECLHSLLGQSEIPETEMEVIVVDNASSDGSADMVASEFPQVRLVRNSVNVGFGAANNDGLAIARSHTVLLLNPDTVVNKDTVRVMRDTLLMDPAVAMVGCRLLNSDGTLQRWTAGGFPTLGRLLRHSFLIGVAFPSSSPCAGLFLESDVGADMDVDWVSGACMAVRLEALDGLLFDSRYFMYGEDMELCHRLSRAGWLIRYTPRTSITHHQGRSTEQSERAQLAALRGPRAFVQLNTRLPVMVWDIFTVVAFGMRATLWSLAALARRRGATERATLAWKYTGRAIRVAVTA